MYYKFEERNCCPQCGGALSHVGSINTLEMFECIECGTRYSVKRLIGLIQRIMQYLMGMMSQ